MKIYYDFEGEKKYQKMKENLRNVNEKQENMRLNSEFKDLKKNSRVCR